jgi:ribonuclease J
MLSFLPLGGMETVTRNMYLYQHGDEILIVDCGLGFADETMLGVDLLLPDISYLLENVTSARGETLPLRGGKKRIVGMVLTHGHEDHIGVSHLCIAADSCFHKRKVKRISARTIGKSCEF